MGIFSFFKKGSKEPRARAVIDVTDANFKQQVIQRSHKTPVLVDFWAAWCGPCQVLGPMLEELAADADSTFVLAKLDTEHNGRTAQHYQIQSIPTVKLFRNGQVMDEFSGVRPGALVRRFVNKGLAKSPPAPKVAGSSEPSKRLAQARRHLAKGRGFEAFVLLDDFPDGPERDAAQKALPVAAFLFDMELGDLAGGGQALDAAYSELARSLRRRQYGAALAQLATIEELYGQSDRIDLAALKEGVAALLDGR